MIIHVVRYRFPLNVFLCFIILSTSFLMNFSIKSSTTLENCIKNEIYNSRHDISLLVITYMYISIYTFLTTRSNLFFFFLSPCTLQFASEGHLVAVCWILARRSFLNRMYLYWTLYVERRRSFGCFLHNFRGRSLEYRLFAKSLGWFPNLVLYLLHRYYISSSTVLIIRSLRICSFRTYQGALTIILRMMGCSASIFAIWLLAAHKAIS